MKKMLLYATALVLITVAGCRKIEEDGQTIYVPVGGGTGGTTGTTITLKGRITSDTILRKVNTYILDGLVYMANNATMTIEPGTTIKGNYQGSGVAALIIARGAKIVANGTQSDPIVFTSNSPVPRSGDWGGIILCGKANINAPAAQGSGAGYEVEGGVNNSNGDGLAGGNVDTDSSGVLRYVRIEYAGYAFQPDKEINSLTMAGVGSKTVIDYVETIYAKDDAFEWFGGTVNCSHLIAYKTQDDDFDTDNGFSGRVQFGIILRDSSIADISRSEGFESDNDANGSTNSPQTKAVFSNITAIGPRATLANNGNSLYLTAAQIRRNSGLSIFNSIFLGWPAGLLIDARNGRVQDLNIQDSTLRFKNNTIAGCGTLTGTDVTSYQYLASTSTPTGWTSDNIKTFFSVAYMNNTVLTNVTDAKLIAPFSYSAPDFVPFGGSNGYQPILTGASFTDTKLTGFTSVAFRGACDAAGENANWWRGWTRFYN